MEFRNGFRFNRYVFLSVTVLLGVVFPVSVQLWLGARYAGPRWLSYVKYLWLLYAPIALSSTIGIFVFGGRKCLHVEPSGRLRGSKVIFQIASRGFNYCAIRRSIEAICYWAPRYLDDFEVWILTEPDYSREFDELTRLCSDGERVRLIVVPREYKPPRGAGHKARALSYAVELRKKLGLVSPRVWVYLLDEESIVGEDTVSSIAAHIAAGGEPIAQGLVIYSNMWRRATVTAAGEGVRPSWELGTEFLPTILFGRKFSWKGSHLLLRSDVETEIGWDHGVYGDDLAFGLKSMDRYRVGWLRGFLYEQSPFTLRESLLQKIRWYENIVDIVLRLRGVNPLYRLALVAELVTWHMSLFGFYLWIVGNPLDYFFLSLLMITLVNASYGVMFNAYFAGETRRGTAAKIAALPLALFILAMIPWIGLPRYILDLVRGEHRFYVVGK